MEKLTISEIRFVFPSSRQIHIFAMMDERKFKDYRLVRKDTANWNFNLRAEKYRESCFGFWELGCKVVKIIRIISE